KARSQGALRTRAQGRAQELHGRRLALRKTRERGRASGNGRTDARGTGRRAGRLAARARILLMDQAAGPIPQDRALLAELERLALGAGRVVMDFYRNGGPVESKADHS